MFKRQNVFSAPLKKSVFLLGPRQSGKSVYLASNFKDARYYDLLNTDEIMRLSKAPYLLREEITQTDKAVLKHPVIIDEIQKVPELLNEIQWLIGHTEAKFILCGSSVRKLKTTHTNLLGGRAHLRHFYPLVSAEIPNFELLKALQNGLLPEHYLCAREEIVDAHNSYVNLYLTDEIRNEGIVRNLQSFARFLDLAGMTNGEQINANNLARDCGINRATVQAYYQILIDTFLGYFIYPYAKKVKRDLITATPKFYLFDVGVANFLSAQAVTALKGAAAGKSFEHFILMELQAYLGIKQKRYEICYWRTKTGLEVDYLLCQRQMPKLAIEVKISEQVNVSEIKGLRAFCEEHPNCKDVIVVSQDKHPRKIELDKKRYITIYPWKIFLEKLWDGELLP